MARARRVYKKGAKNSEYSAYHGTKAQIKRRSQRNKARRAAVKAGRVHKGDGKEVHHVGAKRTGKLNNKRTKVTSRAANRRKQPKRSKR